MFTFHFFSETTFNEILSATFILMMTTAHLLRWENEARTTSNMKMYHPTDAPRLSWFLFVASAISMFFDKTFVNSIIVSSGNPQGMNNCITHICISYTRISFWLFYVCRLVIWLIIFWFDCFGKITLSQSL